MIETLDQKIDEELAEWRRMGIPDPAEAGIHPNTFKESVKLRALLQAMIELNIITQDQLDLAFKKAMLETLQEARQSIIEMRRKALAVPAMHIPKGKMNGH
ncbi:MAG TPA: hypothetical protein VGE97_06565 [Nitrososphaera sp.]|jgi:hypothetical protein